jgi:hypothetical protein
MFHANSTLAQWSKNRQGFLPYFCSVLLLADDRSNRD